MECDKCHKMLLQRETSNKVMKDIGLESGGKTVRVEKVLCDKCYDELFKPKKVVKGGDVFGFASAINMKALDKASPSKKRKVMKALNVKKETEVWD